MKVAIWGIDRGIVVWEKMGMAMGHRGDEQQGLFVPYTQLPKSDGHPFYEALGRILSEHEFDRFVEGLCAKYYARKMGRPGLAPGIYFRCLMVGYFEGIDSERGIAWRADDSLSLRRFIGVAIGNATPDHSTISRTRRLISTETHQQVFTWILSVVAESGLLRGKTLGVDGTTLEANAAMRSIVRRDDGRTYQDFLTDLAKSSGVATPTRDDLARMDRKRKGRKTSNADWESPIDPDAQVTKMKDGRTHLAHKQEHAVDMDSGAVVAVTIHGAAEGDTSTVMKTLEKAEEILAEVRESLGGEESKKPEKKPKEIVGDKGYHSKMVLTALNVAGYRTYIAEPKRGRRNWDGDNHAREATYGNRRRIRGARGRRIMRQRGELVERSFAHNLETGGMRRTHLRCHDNILKRMLVHVAAFNLSLVMRARFGIGKPRALQGRRALIEAILAAFEPLWSLLSRLLRLPPLLPAQPAPPVGPVARPWALYTGAAAF